MSLPLSFSLLMLLAYAVYMLLGFYIISLNTRKAINRLFFAVCMALGIWAFGYSAAMYAPDNGIALAFYRFSSVGWCMLFGLQLHFSAVLVGKETFLKENRWVYALFYLPGLIAVFPFAIMGSLAPSIYNLVPTAIGWINMFPLAGWNLFFVSYFVIYTAASALLLGISTAAVSPENKKTNRWLGLIFTAFLVFALFTEVLFPDPASFMAAQMAPVGMLLLVLFVYYSYRHSAFMVTAPSKTAEPGRILNEASLVKYYQYSSMAFISGSALGFASLYHFAQRPIVPSLLFCFLLFAMGGIIQIISHIPPENELRENIFIPLLALSVPVLTYPFLDIASVTVWVIPAIMILMSIIYHKRSKLLVLGVAIILTQLWVWYQVPYLHPQVSGASHLARIGIFGVLLWLADFVNKTYIQRLEENEAQIKFQIVVSKVSSSFVNVNESNIDEKIQEMLHLCGEFFQSESAYFLSFLRNYQVKLHSWSTDDSRITLDSLPQINARNFPWWAENMIKANEVRIINAAELPAEAAAEKDLMQRYNVRSLSSVVVTHKDKTLGNLFFTVREGSSFWREDYKELLLILVNLLKDAMIKVEAEKEIAYLAFYDGLTGLPNRTLFRNRLEQAIHLARRLEKLIGVVFIDLDAFKAVNDSVGHDGGDKILQQVAERLTECLRKQDTVTRFGGDEYLIMLNQMERIEDIQKVAENLMDAFSQPFAIDQQEFFITASAGIAVYPEDGENVDTLIKNADIAMYTSKEKGKDQFTFCSPHMKDDILSNMKLTNSLYRALERNELSLHYQPQIDANTQAIVGIEALLRWNHPELGAISPVTFIPIAERTGLIKPIGQWVMRAACSQGKAWQDSGLPPIRIAVNLSTEQFHNADLVGMISEILAETGLEAKYLELEITETAAINESLNMIEVLHDLKELGVTIAIDDFGINHSSLNRLKSLPVDRLKIDRQFVYGIEEGSKDEAIAKTIIQLAKNLQLKVIAEGVETETQYIFFHEHLCDDIQGFYFFKPMPPDEIEPILSNKTR